jgi:hypothetical protein
MVGVRNGAVRPKLPLKRALGTSLALLSGMTETGSPKRRRARNERRFIDNAGHMNPEHVERLRQLGGSSEASGEPEIFRHLRDSERDLADSIGEETVATMTSGQQQPPSPGPLEDLDDLSIDGPPDDADVEIVGEPPPDAPLRDDPKQ